MSFWTRIHTNLTDGRNLQATQMIGIDTDSSTSPAQAQSQDPVITFTHSHYGPCLPLSIELGIIIALSSIS